MPKTGLRAMYLSLLAAFICLLLPWSGVGLALRPDFMLLVIIFWILRTPNQCNVGTAWFVGLWVDLATGGIFGQYALTYTITAFYAVAYQRRLVLFNRIQQLAYVLTLLLTSQSILLVLQMFEGKESLNWTYFLSSITGVFVWHIAVTLGLNTGRSSRNDSRSC